MITTHTLKRRDYMLIGDIPRRNAMFYPQETAVIDSDIQFTFKELDSRINKLANGLIELGVQKGDRIAVLLTNKYQYIELYFAAAKIGAPIVPLNFRLIEQELSWILEDSEPKIVFCEKDNLSMTKTLKKSHDFLQHIVCIDEDEIDDDVFNYKQIIKQASDLDPDIHIDVDDLAILGYTGGTTGKPKGVMTTHQNIISSCFHIVMDLRFDQQHRFLNVAPLFHAGDAMGMFTFSFIGGCNVILNSSKPDTILASIEENNITHTLFVPAHILALLQTSIIDQYDISSLECILYGTAPMPLKPLIKALDTFQCKFAQVYGTTETFVPISILSTDDHVIQGSQETMNRMTSAGRPVQGVTVKIVNNQREEVQHKQVGEIVVRGNNVMKGYWNLPKLTMETLSNSWYYTGDVGFLDEKGYLFVVDRKKDMIISGGENIYSKEIEDVLFQHPEIEDCAVIGVPDETYGESIKAFVVLKTSATISEKELIDYCTKYLASYKKPKYIEFTANLPRSTAGKILKHKLREEH